MVLSLGRTPVERSKTGSFFKNVVHILKEKIVRTRDSQVAFACAASQHNYVGNSSVDEDDLFHSCLFYMGPLKT